MNEVIKTQMADSIRNFRMPRYHELPDNGLYLEQVTQYINQTFPSMSGVEITASMISNYVKKGYISRPEKKLYYPEQISYLFFIAIAKNVLCMDHIHKLCAIQKETYTLEVAYDYLCSELENMLFYIFGLKTNPDEVGITSTDEKHMMKSVIVSASNSIYLTTYFNIVQQIENE